MASRPLLPHPPEVHMPDFAKLDEPALIAERRRVREQFERLPARSAERIDLEALLDLITTELNHRAAVAWGEGSDPRRRDRHAMSL